MLLPLFAAAVIRTPSSPIQSSHPRDLHLAITFSGSPAGEATYREDANGAFTATSHLDIAGTVLDNHLTGHFSGGVLHDYELIRKGQGPDAIIRLKEGVLTVTLTDGKPIKLPYDPKLTVYSGNICAQFASSALAHVDFAKKESQTVRTFMIDASAEFSMRITPLGEKTTARGTVRQYRFTTNQVSIEYSMTPDGDIVGMDVPGQKLRMVADGWASLYVDPFAKYPELSHPDFHARKATTQHLRTRDGVDLVQEVILPDAPGPFPVIFARTPYGRAAEAGYANFYVTRGYAYVAQDVRGRPDSGGEWDPMVHEMDDAYDSLDWIAKQPWCDGNVGMIGASYDGFVTWAAAASLHPALKCIVPQVSPPLDVMHNLPYDHGIFFLYGDIWWGKIVRSGKADMSAVLKTLPNPKGFLTLPLADTAKSVLGYDVPFYQKWLERTSLSDWKGWNFYDRLKQVTIPALMISGWWDGDEIGTNMNWAKMRALGRTNQWVIYGPWTHFFNTSSSLGDIDFGPQAMIDLDTLYIRWFDTWLKHKSVGMDKIPHAQAFVTGANRWLKLSDWPAPNSKVETLYLSAVGSARGPDGGGHLAMAPPSHQAPSVIDYDPRTAVIPPSILKVDPSKETLDVTSGLKEAGTLLFESSPLPKATAISGPYEVSLSFRTSAKDTDFFAALLDVDERGHARAFGSTGKLRCSYLQGFDRPRPLVPGRVYVAKIEPWDSAHELKAGHRLALFLTSSGFPMFARNLGTAEPIRTATRMVKQHNEILHDSAHPSAVRYRVLW